jgi:hypothetical protein
MENNTKSNFNLVKKLYILYTWIKSNFNNNELLKNIVGIFIGLSLIFGFISFNLIFTILKYGLLLYSIRLVIEKQIPENKLSENSFIHLAYLYVSLFGSEFVYNLLYFIFYYSGGFFASCILNYSFTYYMTKTIVSLSEWFETNKFQSGNIKNIDFKSLNNDKYSPILINNMNLFIKLYSINCELLDNIIMKYVSKLFISLFDFVNSGTSFMLELFIISYNKLHILANDFKNKKNN